MTRIFSLILMVSMLFSLIGTTGITVYAAGPAHSPREDIPYQGDSESNSSDSDVMEYNSPAHNPRPSDDGPKNTCNHNSVEEYFSDEDCEKYNAEEHVLIGFYVTKCRECREILEKQYGEEKELHDFREGKCKECGYKVKNCKHEKTKEVVSYWYNGVNERGNDASYIEFDVICTYCDVKVDTVIYYGPVTAIPESSNCNHDDVEEKIVKEYYELCTEEKHYKLTKYIVICLECEEEFNSYTEEREENHQIVDGKCTKCIYELPKEVINQEQDLLPSESTSKVDKEKQQTNTPAKDISKEDKDIEVVEDFYISTEYKNYSINGKSILWKNYPREINGKLQVPLREVAEAMGWTVEWDNNKKLAYVIDKEVKKTFIPDCDVYMLNSSGIEKGVALSCESKIINGVFYTDLEALLEETEYAYYKSDKLYRIAERSEIIKWVVKDKVSGRNNLETSETLFYADDYASMFSEEESQVYILEQEDSVWEVRILPALKQAWYGNYYEGETTVDGIIARVVVGEIPFAGTAADLRDVVYHLDEPEWTTEATIDVIAIIPFAGVVKYLPELTKAGKNADEVVDGIKIIADLSKNTDEAAEIAKNTLKVADVARASIKSIDDLKALAKNPKNFKESAWNHIFYGNRDGGYHYKGLMGEKGQIITITQKTNSYGVYRAEVSINGKLKNYESTFFPDDWTPQEVIDSIEEAYSNATHKANGISDYTMQSGMKIRIVFDEYCKIKSAFPLY